MHVNTEEFMRILITGAAGDHIVDELGRASFKE
jgi:hypothetical protein